MAVVAISMGIDQGAYITVRFGFAHFTQHVLRQAQVIERVYQKRFLAVRDQTGVTPPPAPLRGEPGISAMC